MAIIYDFRGPTSYGTSKWKYMWKVKIDQDTPNYFELVRSGKRVPVQNYTYSHEKLYDPIGQEILTRPYRNRLQTIYRTANLNIVFTSFREEETKVDGNVARENLLGKFTEQDVNLAMAWFERKETFSLIADRMTLLVQAGRDVSRGRFSSAAQKLGIKLSQRQKKRLTRRRLNQFSENWLEYRYGWTPLLSDVYAAADLVSQGLLLDAHLLCFRSGDVYKNTVQAVDSTATNRNGWIIHGGRYSTEQRVDVGVYYNIVDPSFRADDALGLENPALIAFDSVPLSFVADWALPLEASIRQITAFKGLRFVDGWESTLIKHSWKATGYNSGGIVGKEYVYSMVDGDLNWEKVLFTRKKLTSFEDLHINPWRFRDGFSPKRALDAVTLYQQFFHSKVPRQ